MDGSFKFELIKVLTVSTVCARSLNWHLSSTRDNKKTHPNQFGKDNLGLFEEGERKKHIEMTVDRDQVFECVY